MRDSGMLFSVGDTEGVHSLTIRNCLNTGIATYLLFDQKYHHSPPLTKFTCVPCTGLSQIGPSSTTLCWGKIHCGHDALNATQYLACQSLRPGRWFDQLGMSIQFS